MRRHGTAKAITTGLGGAVAAVVMTLSGCTTAGRYAHEVGEARRTAAAAWQAQSVETNGALPVLAGSLTLEQAIALALGGNQELRAAREEAEVARGRVLESYGQALPRLSAGMTYTRLDDVSRLDIGGRALTLGVEDNYAVDLTVRQPIFHGAAIPAALRVAKLYALYSDTSVRQAEQGVIFQATKDYADWVLARQLAEVDEQALRLAEALARDVRHKRANGMASDYDVLRAEVEVSNSRAQLIRSQNASELARSRLLKTMGASQHSRIVPDSGLAYEERSADRVEVLRVAMEKRPELLQAEYSLRMQREAVEVARSAYWPKADAFFTQKWTSPDPHNAMSDEWGDAWLGGITGTVPIFDGFERRGRLVQEQARLRQAQTRLLAQEEAVALDVEQALRNLQDAHELVESQKMNLQRAEEGVRLIQTGYREGIQSELAVLDAQTALTRARALYYQALHAHLMARVNLERAMGTLAPPGQ